MKRALGRRELIEIVGGDVEIVEILLAHEILIERSAGFTVIDVDRLLAARTLYRELEVNMAGIEIVLRLREELALARHLAGEVRPLEDE